MTKINELIEAIKADPEGEVARNTAHWLATDVMGWRLVPGPKSYLGHWVEKDADDTDVMEIGEDEFNPFTDANHTRMLVRKVGYAEQNLSVTGNNMLVLDGRPYEWDTIELAPYDDDPTHDACQVLRKCQFEGTLTAEKIEELLG